MRRVKLISVFVLMALVFSGVPGITLAQEPPPPLLERDGLIVLRTPVDQWSDGELETLADLIINEKISVDQTRILLDKLTEEQIVKLGELLGARAGIPQSEVRRLLATRNKSGPSCINPTYPGPIYAWGCYPAEYGYHYILALSHRVTESRECGSRDQDWILWFSLNYNQNPDSLRWYTTSSRVYTVFQIAYKGNLNSFAYYIVGFSGAELVVGKTAAQMAGGINNVERHLYLTSVP